MILQLCILCIIVMLSPLMPPILVPISYSLIGALLIQKVEPGMLGILTISVATISTVIIRILQNYVIKKISIQKKYNQNDNFFFRNLYKLNIYFQNTKKVAKKTLKMEQKIETKTGKFVVFLFAIFCYFPIIPDVISTRLLYKKIKFPYFVLAVIIGKSVTFLPFILVGKSLIKLIHS